MSILFVAASPAVPESIAGTTTALTPVLDSRWGVDKNFGEWTVCQNAAFSGPCSEYDGQFYGASYRFSGDYSRGTALRIELRDGDVPDFGGGERSELALYRPGWVAREGSECELDFWLKFDADFRTGDDFFLFLQWHAGAGPPPLALGVVRPSSIVLLSETASHKARAVIATTEPSSWNFFRMRVRFSVTNERGGSAVWRNNEEVFGWKSFATMTSGLSYLKMGTYRGTSEARRTVLWLDDIRMRCSV